MTSVTEIGITEMLRREDDELYKLVNQWEAATHGYLADTKESGVVLSDQIAALEGQIARHTPLTFVGLVKVLHMAHTIMSARDGYPDSFIGSGPATMLIARAIDAIDHEDGVIGRPETA
jgi:hypothetical protein